MTHASLFSGIGAAELAARMMGWRNLFHCEIDGFCRRILQYHFPEQISYDDIRKTDFTPWRGLVDVLSGGFPCQPFSCAGRRKGTGDDRYLWPEFARAVSEIRPAWVVGENVAGILSMVQPGKTTCMEASRNLFGEEVRQLESRSRFVSETICLDLEDMGYSVRAFVIPACAVGAPHRRDRVFFVAHRDGDRRWNREGEQEHLSRGEAETDDRGPRPGPFAYRADAGIEKVRLEWPDGVLPDGAAAHAERSGCGSLLGDSHPGKPGGIAAPRPRRERSARHAQEQQRPGPRPLQSESRGPEAGQFGGAARPEHTDRLPQDRWMDFPSAQPAVRRGDDGLPFDVDRLAIPYPQWRRQSVKAYGNAIVPQVMFEIFRAIEIATRPPS